MNPEDEEVTPVIFKKLEGEVIALFPADNEGPGMIGSFMRVGQHGAASASLCGTLPSAKPEEYAALKKELESAPYHYRLKVYRRRQPWMRGR